MYITIVFRINTSNRKINKGFDMNFPIKNNVAQYIFEIPSTKEKVSFRPFLVGEHKTMMLALAIEDIDNIVNAIKRIIEICSDGKVNLLQTSTI